MATRWPGTGDLSNDVAIAAATELRGHVEMGSARHSFILHLDMMLGSSSTTSSSRKAKEAPLRKQEGSRVVQ